MVIMCLFCTTYFLDINFKLFNDILMLIRCLIFNLQEWFSVNNKKKKTYYTTTYKHTVNINY